jgi:hypothetical protein
MKLNTMKLNTTSKRSLTRSKAQSSPGHRARNSSCTMRRTKLHAACCCISLALCWGANSVIERPTWSSAYIYIRRKQPLNQESHGLTPARTPTKNRWTVGIDGGRAPLSPVPTDVPPVPTPEVERLVSDPQPPARPHGEDEPGRPRQDPRGHTYTRRVIHIQLICDTLCGVAQSTDCYKCLAIIVGLLQVLCAAPLLQHGNVLQCVRQRRASTVGTTATVIQTSWRQVDHALFKQETLLRTVNAARPS